MNESDRKACSMPSLSMIDLIISDVISSMRGEGSFGALSLPLLAAFFAAFFSFFFFCCKAFFSDLVYFFAFLAAFLSFLSW